jgi:hypothetical protein
MVVTVHAGAYDIVLPSEIYVNTNKFYFECMSNEGAISLTLPKISSVKTWGFWIFINDNGNNASINNITIFSAAGETINGSPTAVINQDRVSYQFYVSGTQSWGYSNAGTGSTPITNQVYIAGANLGGQRLIMYFGGKVYYYNQTESEWGKIVGFSKTAVVINNPVEVISSGKVTNVGWGLTPDVIYYAVPNGLISAIPPVSGVSVAVGLALDADSLEVNIFEQIVAI